MNVKLNNFGTHVSNENECVHDPFERLHTLQVQKGLVNFRSNEKYLQYGNQALSVRKCL